MTAGWCYGQKPGEKPGQTKHPLVVHEWGTFLSVQGSNGEALGGMVDSDEVLPLFVEERGIQAWQRSMMSQKMETPVTYFYTDQPRDVAVRVEMPKGILTHWFPAVRNFGPDPMWKGPPAGSYLDWPIVHLTPSSATSPSKKEAAGLTPPTVGPEQIWRFARQTDSALVRVRALNAKGVAQDQFEKFLFYRGLGTFTLPLAIRSTESAQDGLHLVLQNNDSQPLRGLFAISVEGQTIRFAALDNLDPRARRDFAVGSLLSRPLPLQEGVVQVKCRVADALVAAGLYVKEAQAMVNTWEKSYFRTQGLRVIYTLPRSMVDGIIPIQVKPAPDSLVRVMVGRVEVLTPTQERRIEQLVTDLGAGEFATREAAAAGLARLGRISEPCLHRVFEMTRDPEVRARAQVLLGKIAAGN